MYTEITDNINGIPRWTVMWGFAATIWLIGKILTWRDASGHGLRAGFRYFVAWPGMDPRPFIHGTQPRHRPALHDWLSATLTTLCGAALIWFIARRLHPTHPMLAGWTGMIGTALLMHFGSFRLIAFYWRARGIAVEPIMRAPMLATNLTDFWHRWNRGFRDFAYRLIFLPMHRHTGAIAATLATFLISGLIHDAVISIPAGAGYGLPTLYFLIQGLGIVIEKSPLARRWPAMGRRLFTCVMVIAPLGLLFHRPFVMNVFLPFLNFIGAFEFHGRFAMTLDLTNCLRVAGLLHFSILIAGALTPQVLNWRQELRKLHPVSRHIIWVHGLFIIMTIISFGTITTFFAPALAGGTDLARAFCAFVAIFWGTRLVIQFALFDPGPLLTTTFLKLGYHGLTVVFAYFGLVYGLAALRPVSP